MKKKLQILILLLLIKAKLIGQSVSFDDISKCQNGDRECAGFTEANGWVCPDGIDCNEPGCGTTIDGYWKGNCTAWVYYRSNYKGIGHAKEWASDLPKCEDIGFGVRTCWSSEPASGTIMVDESGYYGHVAYVENLDVDNLGNRRPIVSQYNIIPCHYSYGVYSKTSLKYIYVDGKCNCEIAPTIRSAYATALSGITIKVKITMSGAAICKDVHYTLQRSRDNGATWEKVLTNIVDIFKPVEDVVYNINYCKYVQYQVVKFINGDSVTSNVINAYNITPPKNIKVQDDPLSPDPLRYKFTWDPSLCSDISVANKKYIVSCKCGVDAKKNFSGESYVSNYTPKDPLADNAQYVCSFTANFDGDVSLPGKFTFVTGTGNQYPTMASPVCKSIGCDFYVTWTPITRSDCKGYYIYIYKDNVFKTKLTVDGRSKRSIKYSTAVFKDGNYSATIQARFIPATTDIAYSDAVDTGEDNADYSESDSESAEVIDLTGPRSIRSVPVSVDCNREAPVVSATAKCGTIAISWALTPAQNVLSFYLKRKLSSYPTTAYTTIVQGISGVTFAYDDLNFEIGKSYDYITGVIYTDGTIKESSNTASVVAGNFGAPYISKLSATGKEVELTFYDNSLSETKYLISRKDIVTNEIKEIIEIPGSLQRGSVNIKDYVTNYNSYQYTVAAFGECNPSSSSIISIMKAPSNIKITEADGGLHLTWVVNSNGQTGYNIYKQGDDQVINKIATVKENSYTNKFIVEPNKTYRYYVEAYKYQPIGNISSVSLKCGPAMYRTETICETQSPTINSVKYTLGKINYNVSNPGNIYTGYSLEYFNPFINAWTSIGEYTSFGINSVNFPNPPDGQIIQFSVKGYKIENGSKCYSLRSNVTDAIYIIGKPTNCNISTKGTIITLTWDYPNYDFGSINGFKIYRNGSNALLKQTNDYGVTKKFEFEIGCNEKASFYVTAYNSYENCESDRSQSSDEIVTDCMSKPLTVNMITNGMNPELSWDMLYNFADGYKIYRNGQYYATVNGVNNTKFIDNIAICGTTQYKYEVVAYFKHLNLTDQESPRSNACTFVKECPPNAPYLYSIDDDLQGNPVLKWNLVDKAESYSIYRNNIKIGYVICNGIVPCNNYTDILANLTCRTNTYEVIAVNYWGSSAKSNTQSFFKDCSPAKPSAPSIINTTSGLPKIIWSKITGADSYKIHIKPEGVTAILINTINSGDITSWVDNKTSFECYDKFQYRIGACNEYGCKYSDYSNSWVYKAGCTPGKPSLSYEYNSSNTSVTLKWGAVSGVINGYNVYRNGTKIGSTTGLTYNSSLNCGDNIYAVAGYNSYEEGSESDSKTVKLTCCTPPSSPGQPTVSTIGGAPCVLKISWTSSSGTTPTYILTHTKPNGTQSFYNTGSDTYVNVTVPTGNNKFKVEANNSCGSAVSLEKQYTQPFCSMSGVVQPGLPSTLKSATDIEGINTADIIFTAYPNPANSTITFVINQKLEKPAKLHISNILGLKVISRNIDSKADDLSTSISIDIAGLPTGQYIATLITPTKITRLGFIKQ